MLGVSCDFTSRRCVRWKSVARVAACLVLCLFPFASQPSNAQQSSDSDARSAPTEPEPSPAFVSASGPQVSLQTNEALFDIAATLNSCGYDHGLAQSDPVRQKIREEMNQALQASAAARDQHDQICAFIARRKLPDAGLDLAQYISLALYVTPPPAMTPSVENAEMPPDSMQVIDILPLLRKFSETMNLHAIWVESRPQYDEELARLHDSLNRMIVQTNAYLKVPVDSTGNQRFSVVVEPLLDPAQTNARLYGADYVVVVSPVDGAIRMNDVRHTYLHFQIEPLLYARATAINRLSPFLKIVQDAPIDYSDRTDVVALVAECMIRAIEARTMNTGITIYQIPANFDRNNIDEASRKYNATFHADEAIRLKSVQQSISQGYILTGYFYNEFAQFEREPQSFTESIGPMVYGMDINIEVNRLKNTEFVSQAPPDIVIRPPAAQDPLDLAEAALAKGDSATASKLAMQALQMKTPDAGRANFILARASILMRNVPGAENYFEQAINLSKDPRTLAWAHIYLGRIYDIEQNRDQAVTEYRAALTVRDGQADTKVAAEKGIAQPYTVPSQTHEAPDDGSDGGSSQPEGAARPAHPSQPQ